MKSAKFIISSNLIVNDGRVYITHMRDPVIIAEVFNFGLDQEQEWMTIKSQFNIGASVDYPGRLIALGAVYVAPVDWHGQEAVDKLSKIMSRMGDWYHNYLKWSNERL